MGGTQSKNEQQIKINFDDVKWLVEKKTGILINTLKKEEQNCLISGTIEVDKEEMIINKYLQNDKNINIIIYGKNCSDETTIKKYEQLTKLGFYNVYIYLGGLFEWLLLQDIYGREEFPTTNYTLDILKYKPNKKFSVNLLEN